MGPTREELHLQVQTRLIEELSEKQAAHLTHLDLLEEIVFRCCSSGELKMLNQAWARKMGRSIEASLGSNLLDFVHAEQRDELRRQLQDDDVLNTELGISRGFGDLRTMTLNARKRSGEWYGSMHDVTEQRLTLNALRESEDETRKLSLVASRTDNLVIITDAKGRVEWVNQGFTKASGYTLAEMRGRTPGSLLQGPETDLGVVSEIRSALETGDGFKVEIVNYNKQGCPYWVAIDCTPVYGADGQLTNFIAIERDINDRKLAESRLRESERRFRHILDSVSEAIFRCDADLKLRFVNPAWANITSYSQKKSLGCALVDFAQASDHATLLALPDQLRVSSSGVLRREIILTTGQRVELVLSHSGSDDDGRPEFTGALIDIDERWQVTQAIVQAKQRAEELSAARTRFVANMSHEIRTPLNAILGMSSVLEATELSDEQRTCLETIRTGSNALLALIGDVLDVAKLDSGEVQLDEAPFSWTGVFEDAIDIVASSAEEKGLQLTLNGAANLPETLVGDADRLRQVVINLLSNALKFTRKGGIHIELDWKVIGPKMGRLGVSISDTGIGIPSGRIETLFDAFTQADVSTTRRYGGTGLGLAICRQICERMNGRIWAHSKIDEGSVFQFEVQLGAVDAKSGDQDNHGNLRGSNLRPRTVEIVRGMARLRNIPVQFDEDGTADSERLRWVEDEKTRADLNLADLNSILTANRIWRKLQAQVELSADHRLQVQSHQHLPQKILVAEDVVANQIVIKAMLAQLGQRDIKIVENGAKAVAAFSDQKYDLVILDLHMPIMDGLEAAKLIRNAKSSSSPMVVAASADVTTDAQHAAKEAGFDTWLAKPITREALEGILMDVSKRKLPGSQQAAATVRPGIQR